PILGPANGSQEMRYLIAAEHDRQGPFCLGTDDAIKNPVATQSHSVEELQCATNLIEKRRRGTLLRQMDQVRTHLALVQHVRRFAVVLCQLGDGTDIRLLRVRRQVPQLQVFDHSLTQGSHGCLQKRMVLKNKTPSIVARKTPMISACRGVFLAERTKCQWRRTMQLSAAINCITLHKLHNRIRKNVSKTHCY